MKLTESNYFENYYHVPDNERLIINREGIVIDLRMMCCVLTTVNKAGYVTLNIYGQGTLLMHRLLATTFISKPFHDVKLVVNHKDGIKVNNDLDNIEWTTYTGNVVHAHMSGLSKSARPVLSKCLESGEVLRFYSISDAAHYFKVDMNLVNNYIKGKIPYKFLGKYDLVLEEDGFRGLDAYKVIKDVSLDRRIVLLKDEVLYLFDSPEAASYYLDVTRPSIYKKLNTDRVSNDKSFNCWYYREYDVDKLDDIKVMRGSFKVNAPTKISKPITVEDSETGLVTEWDDIYSFSNAVGYSRSTIQKSMHRTNGFWGQYKITYN